MDNNSKPGSFAEVLKVALPLILSSSCHAMNMFVDRLMLTRYSQAASAASFTGGLTHFTLSCLFFGTIGYTGTFVAQYAGARQYRRIGQTVWQGIFLSLAGGAVLSTGIFWAEPLFKLFKHDPAVTIQEIKYFQVLAAGSALFLLMAALSSFWSGRGKTLLVLLVSAIITLFNIPLNYIFIFGACGVPEMGATGAALGTLVAEAIGLLICLIMFFLPPVRKVYHTAEAGIDFPLIGRMLRYGLPNGAQLALDLIAFNAFGVILGCYGVNVHEGTSITFGINNIAFCPIMGIGQTAAILVGQSIGAQDIPTARKSVRKSYILVVAYAMVMIMLFTFFQDWVLSPFIRQGDSSQLETIRIARIMLFYLAGWLLFDGTAITFSNVLRGAGDTSFTMWTLALVGIGGFTIPCIILYLCGAPWWALWLALYAELLMLSATYLLRYKQGKWSRMRVIEREP